MRILFNGVLRELRDMTDEEYEAAKERETYRGPPVTKMQRDEYFEKVLRPIYESMPIRKR